MESSSFKGVSCTNSPGCHGRRETTRAPLTLILSVQVNSDSLTVRSCTWPRYTTTAMGRRLSMRPLSVRIQACHMPCRATEPYGGELVGAADDQADASLKSTHILHGAESLTIR